MVKTINKGTIAEEISQELGLSRSQSLEMVNDIVDVMLDIIENEGKLRVPYFGTFSTKIKNPRMGRNPKTQEIHSIPARKLITFKASDFFKNYVNDNDSPVSEND